MGDFHYDYINNKYGDKTEMLLTDTDSFMYKIERENVHEDLYKVKELFDFNNHPKYSKYYNNANNLVAGKMKDERSDVPIKGFVGSDSLRCVTKVLITANFFFKMFSCFYKH